MTSGQASSIDDRQIIITRPRRESLSLFLLCIYTKFFLFLSLPTHPCVAPRMRKYPVSKLFIQNVIRNWPGLLTSPCIGVLEWNRAKFKLSDIAGFDWLYAYLCSALVCTEYRPNGGGLNYHYLPPYLVPFPAGSRYRFFFFRVPRIEISTGFWALGPKRYNAQAKSPKLSRTVTAGFFFAEIGPFVSLPSPPG